MTPLVALAVVGAGALGALLRYAASRIGARQPGGSPWPWPVLLVNVVGSLVAGVAFHSDLALVVVTGFCGGLTTFSTLSVETIQLVAERRTRAAAASVALNLVLGIAAAAVGWALGTVLF
jgi:Integral membrane protein possibly involved in chromosome condensation